MTPGNTTHQPTNVYSTAYLERSTVHCAQGAQHQDSTGRRRGEVILLAYHRCYDTPFKWTLQMVNEDAYVYKVKELCQNGHIICQFRHKSLASVRKHNHAVYCLSHDLQPIRMIGSGHLTTFKRLIAHLSTQYRILKVCNSCQVFCREQAIYK